MTKRGQNSFYILAGAIGILLAVYVVFIARGIITSIGVATKLDESVLEYANPRLNKQNLEQAREAIYSKDPPLLDLRVQ